MEHSTGLASQLAPVHLHLLALRGLHHLDARPLLHLGGHHAHPLENHQDRVAARHHHRRLDGRQPAGPPGLPQVELLRHLLLLPPGHLPQPRDHLRSAHRPSVGIINIKPDTMDPGGKTHGRSKHPRDQMGIHHTTQGPWPR